MNLLTISDVMNKLQMKRTSFYELRKKGNFPEPINITGNARGQRWLEEDIDNFLLSQKTICFEEKEYNDATM